MYEEEAKNLKQRFWARGYSRKSLKQAYQWPKASPRDLFFFQGKIKLASQNLRFIATFNNQSEGIRNIMKKTLA